jgi:glycosyltransferase involved in cell wall biosynthesis
MQYARRLFFIASYRILGVERARKRLYWKAARLLGGKYKNVIAYQESIASDFARYIDAPNRVAWMHTDYDKLGDLSPQYASREMYDCYNHIASVTQSSADRMIEALGRDYDTVHVVRNPLIPETIMQRSNEPISPEDKKKKPFLIVSVGRLSPEKAFHRVPHVANLLKDAQLDFDWYIIGDGAARGEIENEIRNTDTEDVVHLLGAKTNPYPYMRMADVLVITSLYEAQPMVANEALILGTPVVSTEFSSVREVVTANVNGLIVEQSVDSIFSALSKIALDSSLFFCIKCGAAQFKYSNEQILNPINKML